MWYDQGHLATGERNTWVHVEAGLQWDSEYIFKYLEYEIQVEKLGWQDLDKREYREDNRNSWYQNKSVGTSILNQL